MKIVPLFGGGGGSDVRSSKTSKAAVAAGGRGDGGSALYQYVATFTGTLTIIASGMHYGWPAPSLPKLEQNESGLVLSGDEGSWMAVMPLLGAIIGSLMVGITVDHLGRKRTILLTSVPFFGAWLMIGLTESLVVLYVARFVAGVSDGWAFTAVPMYIGEIAQPSIRGLLGSCVSVAWIFGTLLINLIGSYLSIGTAALVASLVPLAAILTFVWMPESPYYLLMRGQHKQAEKSLKMLRGVDNVTEEQTRLNMAVKQQRGDGSSGAKFLDLFRTHSNRKGVLVIVILRAAQQLSGTTAITFYTQYIFHEAGSAISSELATSVYFCVQLLLTTLCSGIVDRAGRRPLLILSLIGSALALALLGSYFLVKAHTDLDMTPYSYLPIVFLIGFVVAFSSGMQSIPILMLGELFSPNVKAIALCLADIYFCLLATIVSKFFQFMKDSFGMHVPFFVFTICCLLMVIAIVLVVPETKGKTLEQIQSQLGEKRSTGGDRWDDVVVGQKTATASSKIETFRPIDSIYL